MKMSSSSGSARAMRDAIDAETIAMNLAGDSYITLENARRHYENSVRAGRNPIVDFLLPEGIAASSAAASSYTPKKKRQPLDTPASLSTPYSASPVSHIPSAFSVIQPSAQRIDQMFEAANTQLPIFPLDTARMLASNIAVRQPRKRKSKTGVYKRSKKVTVESLQKKKISKKNAAKKSMGLTRN